MRVQTLLATKGNKVVTIGHRQLIREAVSLLTKQNIGALVVVDQVTDKPVGMVSERDIVRKAAEREELFADQVETIMSAPLIFGTLQDELISVARTMEVERIRHLPIVDRDRLVGIISIGDVLKAQRDAFDGEATTLKIQMSVDDNTA